MDNQASIKLYDGMLPVINNGVMINALITGEVYKASITSFFMVGAVANCYKYIKVNIITISVLSQ